MLSVIHVVVALCEISCVLSASKHSYRYLHDGEILSSSRPLQTFRDLNSARRSADNLPHQLRLRALDPSNEDNETSVMGGFGSWDGPGSSSFDDVQIIAQWHYYNPILVIDRNFYCKFPEKTCHHEFSGHSLLISNQFAGCREIKKLGQLHFEVSIDPECSGVSSFPTCDTVDRNETWQLFENCDDYYLVDSECRYDCMHKGSWSSSSNVTAKLKCSFEYDKNNLWGLRDDHIGMCYIQDGECVSDSLEKHRIFCIGFKPNALSSGIDSEEPKRNETLAFPATDENVLLCPGSDASYACTNATCNVYFDYSSDQVQNGCPKGQYLWGEYGLGCYANGLPDEPCFKYSSDESDITFVHGSKSCSGVWSDWTECRYSPFEGCSRKRDFTANATVECLWQQRTASSKCECGEPSTKQIDDPPGFSSMELPCIGGFDEWGKCSDMCLRKRTYHVIAPALNGGGSCSGADGDLEYESCNEDRDHCKHPYAADTRHGRDVVVTDPTPPMVLYAEKFKRETNGLCDGTWSRFTACDELCRKYSVLSIKNTSTSAACPEHHAHTAAVQCASSECAPIGVKTLIRFKDLDYDKVSPRMEEFAGVVVPILSRYARCHSEQVSVVGLSRGSVIAEVHIMPPTRKPKHGERAVFPGEIFDKLQQLPNLYEMSLGPFGKSSVDSVSRVGVVPVDPVMIPQDGDGKTSALVLLIVGVVLGWVVILIATIALIFICRRKRGAPLSSRDATVSHDEVGGKQIDMAAVFGRGGEGNAKTPEGASKLEKIDIDKMPTATDVELL